MLEDLCGPLLRFRLHKVALVSDLEKASFLQVGLQTSEQDLTRFLWVKDLTKPTLANNLISYRFQRVPFGVIASPFLLAATVVYHLNRIGTPTAKKILKNIYVDNIIKGTECTEQALLNYKEAKAVFSSASMNLREWYSNDPVFIQSIPEEDRGKGTMSTILGMVWDTPKDTLSCSLGKLASKSVINTNRLMLQSIAKLFDPCGFFSPTAVSGKLILQELWKKQYEWDEILPGELLQTWQNFYSEFVRIPELPIARCFNEFIDNESTVFELHCFWDASAKAYAAVVHLRAAVNGEVQVALIFSKVRICPIKAQTIPRLELTAVTIGSRILEYVEKQLQLVISKKFLWSDSQCTLHWILGKEVSTTFVLNRVREIKKHSGVELRHVPTEANPADIPSRGVGFEHLKESTLWWHGPKWLCYCTELWPENPIPPEIRSAKEIDSSQEADTCFPVSEMESAEKGMDVHTFSSLRRLLRVTAWMRRFKGNASKLKIRSGPLNADEILEAEIVWQKQIQKKYFSNVLSDKKRGGIAHRLGLFRDQDGMLRCSGRFDSAELAYSTKYSKLLPKDDAFTDLIIADCHERLCHAGVKHTLAMLRNQYWVCQGRSQVKKIIRRCLVCKRQSGGPYRTPDPPPLPDFRTSANPPFANVELDYLLGRGRKLMPFLLYYLGPLYIKVPNNSLEKVWICLFTCASTRAVHLEAVQKLSSEEFLLCLRRFMSFYGRPVLIVCDNAKQFHKAERVLCKLWQEVCESVAVQDYSSQNGIRWKFITELAPWMGGFYERMVGIVKKALKRTINRKRLQLVELQTVIYEVACVVNSRPLVYNEDEIGDSPITPSHLLLRHRPDFPSALGADPDQDFDPNPAAHEKLILRWKRLQAILDAFWKMWRNHYLVALREQAWSPGQRNASKLQPEVGTVVLNHDDLPRARWRLGRITELIFSSDRV